MSNSTLILDVLIGVCLLGSAVVGWLLYTKRLSLEKALLFWGVATAVLTALITGWRAGKKTNGEVKPASMEPPLPTAGKIAMTAIVTDTKERVAVIEEAERDTNELERLRRLSQP